MHDDDVTSMLSRDFDALVLNLERDRTGERIIHKIGARGRARLGIIGLASGLGGVVAASQFSDVATAFAASVGGANAASGYASPEFLATLVVAAALTATAFVMRREA